MELFSAVSEWFFQDLIGGNWTFYLQNLPRLLVAGLLEGMILAVIALAFVLIYRTTEIVNFAQGDFMALSIFIMLVLTQWIGPEMFYGVYPDGPWSMLVPWLISAALTIVLMIGFSIGTDLLIFRNLAGQSPLAIVIITIALGFIPLIVGIVGFAMAGAACCGCCKANPNAQNPGGTVVQGSVVAKS